LGNLTLKIVVVPRFINLDVKEMFISEGQTRVITEEDLKISPDFYTDKVKEYVVEQQPMHGILELTTRTGVGVHAFTPEQLRDGLVQVYWFLFHCPVLNFLENHFVDQQYIHIFFFLNIKLNGISYDNICALSKKLL
jgi:hypothetical protein